MNKDLPIIALDFPSGQEALSFLDQFNETLNVKVGMELYYAEGPALIKAIKQRGHHIFLDLKLHDIPNTVKRAMSVLAHLEVDMVNVHATGGQDMLEAALKGLTQGTPEGKKRPLIIAVTQLTSTHPEDLFKEQGVEESLEANVLRLAKLTKDSGLDGVVCSALESTMIKEEVGRDFMTITPGIRLEDAKADDQTRVLTPIKAKQAGSHYIVVGRPITQADNPVKAYHNIAFQWQSAF
ncbi:orotidine-5'-phosphate decarboxylase [Dolosicoccus paucivorans]|uniref:Orotidine 5'-phosphate decarboxylase n=1 Tax=Dolosicoccus paucivorans TaxID=84521 RepID=A0A1G8P7F7_9LACT|nr:orotidine-5'-phosphate decarboxylase [Dolosicoccus paucivorans]PMB83915.1 orotidine-5'-phosphate decarboxylase [Dolosicoccus paucivorans]PMC58122.1 orotidine-5'-phosphate decarboxylase [Dolosicoccus paucivorans]SDI88434.1 orotidine-5'-phosphate decarboxylase [Dolosicoccus paucivorans]